MKLKNNLRASYDSPIAFFLGKEADRETKNRIISRGFIVLEGRYDILVYHPDHWKLINQGEKSQRINEASQLPRDGILEAGIDYPYSHAIVPESIEAKLLLRSLFGLGKGKTFLGIIKEANEKRGMTRRGFLKNLGKAAGAAASATNPALGALAKGAKSAISVNNLIGSLSTGQGKAVGSWLATEIGYRALGEVIGERWPMARKHWKEIAKVPENDLRLYDRYLKGLSLDNHKMFDKDGYYIDNTNFDIDELITIGDKALNSMPEADYAVRRVWNGVAEKEFAAYERKAGDIKTALDLEKSSENALNPNISNEELRNLEDEEYREYKKRESERQQDNQADDLDDLADEPYKDDYDGDFDDLDYDDEYDDPDRPWLGESKQIIAIPSLRHLSKAWPDGKKSWIAEIDRVLK